MALHIKTPSTNSTVSVSSIPNVVGGSLGLIPQNVSGGDTDSGFYQVDSPWSVNLNGQLYNSLYVSSKSFLSFGTAAVDGSPTTPTSNKILLGNRKNTSVPDTYSKNFYYAVSGNIGNRTLRMRYEGGFKVSPTNITSSSITNTILGRASLDQYNFSGSPAYTELILPWNANFYTTAGTIQNVVRVYSDSYIEFGKHNLVNGSANFSANGNYLNIGSYTGGFVGVGTGLWSGIEGSSPNRRYRIRYEGYDNAKVGKPVTAWEVIFYENNKDIIEVQTATTPDYFTLDQNGWYSNFNSTLVADLTNTSGNYNNRGTRLRQTYTDTSLIWEATVYEDNTNRIDIQLGSRGYSASSLTWNIRTSGNFPNSNSAASFANGTYVVTSYSNPSLITSTNTIVWTQRTCANVSMYSVDYINNQFIVVGSYDGSNAIIRVSTNAIVWSARTLGANIATGGGGSSPGNPSLIDITYGNNLYVASGSYIGSSGGTPTASLFVSTDSIVWTTRTTGVADGREFSSISAGNGIYVACGTNAGSNRGSVFTSTDTIVWTSYQADGFQGRYQEVLFANGQFIVVGGAVGGNTYLLATSTNGIAWRLRTAGPGTADILDYLQSIAFSGDSYVVVDNAGGIRTSTDAIVWSLNNNYAPDRLYFVSHTSNNVFITGGRNGNLLVSSSVDLSAENYYYGVYSSDTSLYQFPITLNAGYQIISTYTTPAWATIQNVYAKVTSNWQTVRNLYVRDSGLWKLVHPNTNGPVYFFCKRGTYENDIYGNKGGTGIASFQNDTFIVPDGVTTITVELWGGGGSGGSITGVNNIGSFGGGGGYVKATLSVTPGETLIVRVGGGGWQYAANVTVHPNQPLTGGTVSVVSRRSDVLSSNQAINGPIGGSGGGYSAIFRGSTPLLVAGGGGGGGASLQDGIISFGGNGGAGGGNIGLAGQDGDSKKAFTPPYPARGGGGGSQISGGVGGASGQTNRAICAGLPGENGSYLQGGRGTNSPELQTTNLVTHGTASNPGTNGGAAGGGGSRTGATVCYDGSGTIPYAANTLYASQATGGGGGGGYYGGGGGGCGFYYLPLDTLGTGGGGGGGGSNYVGGAASVISNSQGAWDGNPRTPGNTTSPYYLTSYLYAPSGSVPGVPFNAFAQGGAGYGGTRALGDSFTGSGIPSGNVNYGGRGENGLVVIYW